MNKIWKNKRIWLSALALILVLASSVPPTMAYFTTYVKAKGGYPITLGNKTEIEEKVESMTKKIVLKNTGETDSYVRVRVFTGSEFDITYSGSSKWKQDGKYWYYSDILKPGEETEELWAKITYPDDFKESFNIVVIQESTNVIYDKAGNPSADWTRIADTKSDVGVKTGGTD